MSDLNRFLADIFSVYWWLTVVLVSLATNLASAYLKPPLDNFFLKHSDRRRRKIIAENDNLETEAGILLKDSDLLILKGFEEVRWFVLSIFLLLFAFGMAYLGSHVSSLSGLASPRLFLSALLFLLAIAIFTLALWAFQRASNITLVLLTTRRKKFTELLARAEGVSAKSPAQEASDARTI